MRRGEAGRRDPGGGGRRRPRPAGARDVRAGKAAPGNRRAAASRPVPSRAKAASGGARAERSGVCLSGSWHEYFVFDLVGESLPSNKQHQNKMTLIEQSVFLQARPCRAARWSPGRLGACEKSQSPLPLSAVDLFGTCPVFWRVTCVPLQRWFRIPLQVSCSKNCGGSQLELLASQLRSCQVPPRIKLGFGGVCFCGIFCLFGLVLFLLGFGFFLNRCFNLQHAL